MIAHFPSLPSPSGHELPESRLSYCAELGKMPAVQDEARVLMRAIREPIGMAGLERLIRGSSRVSVVVDDLTRPTPQERLLPVLLDHLQTLGVTRSHVRVVIALGTHRPMSREEILARFGASVVGRVEIRNHDYRDSSKHVSLGATPLGTPVEVNRDVYEADLRILVGTVMPHPYAGWGGGAKLIQPGVSSERTTECTHVLAGTRDDLLSLPGNPDNVIRAEMESVARALGPTFAINTVLDEEGRLVGVCCGEPVLSHRTAVAQADSLFRPQVGTRADIVVCDAYPCHRDYWQGFKAYVYAHLGVKQGGTIIFLFPAPEGLAGNAPRHGPTLRAWATREVEEILGRMDDGSLEDRIGASTCVAHRRLLDRATVVCVSAGLAKEEIECLGFLQAASLATALEMAFAAQGPNATLGVLRHGGETLVRVKEPEVNGSGPAVRRRSKDGRA